MKTSKFISSLVLGFAFVVIAWVPVQAKTIHAAAVGTVNKVGTTSFTAAARAGAPKALAFNQAVSNTPLSHGVAPNVAKRSPFKEAREMPSERQLMQRIRAQAERKHPLRIQNRPAAQGGGIIGAQVIRVISNHYRRRGNNRVFGFDGLNNRDQAGAIGGSISPPDQGLAVGNNQVLEAINLALAVFNPKTGVQRGPTVSLYSFFNKPTSDLLSDPRVYYDAPTGHFFISILDANFATGKSSILIAVSTTRDATGPYSIFSLPTTDDGTDGTPNDPGCPCFGDQPLIGADANGFYVSTNEFPLFAPGFNGANVYALDKLALANGASGVNFQLFQPGPLTFSIQPATTPPNGRFESAQGGTEYFLSSLDIFGQFTNQIGVWAATNTSSLQTVPDVSLQETDVDSQFYADPPPIEQKSGPTPLADALNNGFFGPDFGVKEEMVDSGDDRMMQTVFAGGKLFAGLNTVVGVKIAIKPGGGFNDKKARAGIAYFVVKPQLLNNGTLMAKLQIGGYLAVRKDSVVYPSIGVNRNGRGVMAFSLIGPRTYPSSAFVDFNGDRGVRGPVRLVADGVAPDDGFTGYYPFVGGPNPGTARWGDYSAASADENGNIWMGTEYIPDRPRLLFANWGTFINRVNVR